jgi:AAA+ superfamily predicted ATPase
MNSDHHHGHSKVGEAMAVTPALHDQQLKDSWDRIVVDPAIKNRLLNHALMSISLRKAGIGGVGLPLHGLLLLNGLPGVGKTTLARGLAHAVAENLGDRYGVVRLVDVNMHLLPSELLGRTQRNVVQLFQEELPALAEDGPTVVVLDEVEVLAVSRSEASLDINPADVFRGTAALLSALDWISREAPGVLVVGTTNLAGALDDAVVSRADLVMELPLPDASVIRQILADTLSDLGRHFPACGALAAASELGEVAELLGGIDGRQARKFIADALASERATALDPSGLQMRTLIELAKTRGWGARRPELLAASERV